jgi:glutamine synthetase
MPAKGQELEDHYFGAIKDRVMAFMGELNRELWKMGVSAKTQHNEVAPNQFELAPIFATTNVATDNNQLVMETIRKVANRHEMVALLHEKPFAGVNGSGKHNNWSISTDDGQNLLDPGENPQTNARFLLFTTAVLEAVDTWASLLRASAANPGNDHRLGANEAPPAIISAFLGSQLSELLDSIAEDKPYSLKGGEKIALGVTSLPRLPRDFSDRNRTSPFAFTGNKFEFRMVGSSQSIASANCVINTIVADALANIADRLEKASDKNAEIQKYIKESYSKHRRVVFDGNNYAKEWVAEAERRGLPNIRNTVDAIGEYIKPAAIELFERNSVLSKEELESRAHIYWENYSKRINIEASVMVEMSKRSIFPAVTDYAASLASSAEALASIKAVSAPQEKRAREIAQLLGKFSEETEKLEAVLGEAQGISDVFAQAKAFRDKVFVQMGVVRESGDKLETMVDRDVWPFPSYEELLFIL